MNQNIVDRLNVETFLDFSKRSEIKMHEDGQGQQPSQDDIYGRETSAFVKLDNNGENEIETYQRVGETWCSSWRMFV